MTSATGGVTENVRVVVRSRPLNQSEIKQGFATVINVDEIGGVISVSSPDASAGEPAKDFTFDFVFGPDSKQMNIYNQIARPIVENVFEGYNGTIFAYGQTGTGKTFTMEGDRDVPELKGIIPNSFAHIFDHIAKSGETKTFLVRVSYLEIYNEEIRDLLGKDQSLKLEIKERPDVGVYVKDLTSVTVGSADEMDKIMTLGNKNRSVGATNMNEQSSRSHAIFSVTVECSEKGADNRQHVRVGKLHLVDLAGSERQSKTGATGQRLKEATKINLSLSTLGNVISALVDAKASHVPYRNSKLTRLLQDSLGGNSKTVMIANVGPAGYNYDESISTLRYANRAKQIKNQAKINEDPKDALLRKFQQEIEELRKQLADEGGADQAGGSGAAEDSEEADSAGEKAEGVTAPKEKKKRKKPLSEEKMRELEARIAEDKQRLTDESNLVESERQKILDDLSKKEHDLEIARQEHDLLVKKLQHIERKVIVGGENLLDKAELQARLLEESQAELEQRRRKEAELKKALAQKQQERVDIEEKYSSLQEEVAGKTQKLKKVWKLLTSANSEKQDLQAEHQREMEGLLENVRQLSKELRLQMLVIDSFIPQEYLELIERNVHWNEEIGDWQLKCVAYTGNNMRKRETSEQAEPYGYVPPDLSGAYLSYADVLGSKEATGDSKRSAAKTKKSTRVSTASLSTKLELLISVTSCRFGSDFCPIGIGLLFTWIRARLRVHITARDPITLV